LKFNIAFWTTNLKLTVKHTFSSTVGPRISEATEANYSTGLWITGEVSTGIVLWYAVDITNSRREVVWRAVITVGTLEVW